MKQESRKLSLKRETLMPMNDEELTNVHGGTWSAVGRSLVAVSKWSSKGCASAAVVDSVVESYNQTRRLFGGGEKK